jgi:hypothetical protein
MPRRDDELAPSETEKLRELVRLHDDFLYFLKELGHTRELSLAVTNLEQAAMWAERHIKAH